MSKNYNGRNYKIFKTIIIILINQNLLIYLEKKILMSGFSLVHGFKHK